MDPSATIAPKPLPFYPNIITELAKTRATLVRVYFTISILCSSAFLGLRCHGAICFPFTTLSLFVLLLACLHSSLFILFCFFFCCSLSCLFLLLVLHFLFLLSFFSVPFLLFSSVFLLVLTVSALPFLQRL